MANKIPLRERRNEDAKSWTDLIRAVNQPLGFFTLAVLIAEAGLVAARFGLGDEAKLVLVKGMVGLIFVSVLAVAAMAVFRRDALYSVTAEPPQARAPTPSGSKLPPTAPPPTERTTGSGERPPIVGENNPPPAAGVWYKEIRPVLHQAVHYTVPTYYLDVNLMIVDWNIAFDLVFSKLGSGLRDKHVKHFINELENFDEVMDHAREFTRKVLSGRIPFVDVEPLRYASERYGEVSFLKVATQLHGPDGNPRGWSVSLILREIDWPAFEKDLLEEARKDKLWGIYSASYDRVLLAFDPYKQLIKDVIGVVPPGRQSVADLGAGTGNTTKELLAAGYTVTAVENNLGMLDRLRSKNLEGRLTVIKSSVEDLTTLETQPFDAAVMVNVLYAVDDPLACLQAVYGILKPNGVLGLSTTHSDSELDRLLNSIKTQLVNKGKFDKLRNDYQILHDVNKLIERDIAKRHSRDKYREWIRAAGFTIIRDVPNTYEDAVMLVWAQKR
jgi:ubiquinone/menaquinone biosynthesis C-methylase UbiE